MNQIIGAMTALITPFKDGEVDYDCYASLIERQIRHGIDAVVPVGTTGESATLTHEEHQKCIEVAVEVCKNSATKVLAGAGSNSTREAISLAQFAEKAGADGILTVTPYYNRPTQEGLYQHYKTLAESITIPVMLYNVPGRTGVGLKIDTIVRLCDDLPNISSIKEATGSMSRVVELNAARGDQIAIISGDDPINYPIMSCGGKGVISVTANLLPDLISSLVKASLEGRYDEAKTINNQLYTINKAMGVETNPIPIKAAMFDSRLLDSLEYRLPLVPPSDESREKIKAALQGVEVPQ